MSISITESRDTLKAYDAIQDRKERIEKAEQALIEEFETACQKADANAICLWSGHVVDWSQCPSPISTNQPKPLRSQVLHEVMAESLDYADGPSMSEAMQLILNVANGMDCKDMAQKLVNRMAQTYAKFNAEDV